MFITNMVFDGLFVLLSRLKLDLCRLMPKEYRRSAGGMLRFDERAWRLRRRVLKEPSALTMNWHNQRRGMFGGVVAGGR